MQSMKDYAVKFLRWSEKYTKTDMLYLFKSGFWISFGQIFSSILSLGLVIAFANLLPKETYGIYKYILSLASVLNIFTLTGMNNAVSRSVAIGDEGSFVNSVKYQLKWNLLMFVAFLTLSVYYFINGNTLLMLSFLILGLFVPSTFALNTYGAYLEGKKEFKLAGIFSSISSLVYVVGILVAIIFSGEVIWLIFAYAITTFLSTLIFYFFVLIKFKPQNNKSPETLKYGRELTFISFIGPITSQMDKIIITHFWGPAQLAIYSLATVVPDRATSLIKNLVGVGFPKFSNKTPKEIDIMFYQRILQGMIFGAISTLGYIIIAPYLFKYLLPQYLESIYYSQLLAISMIFAIPNRFISLLLVSQKFSRLIFSNSIIQNIIKIILYIILGILGGVMGLVIAFVTHTGLSMIINIIVWKKRESLSFPKKI